MDRATRLHVNALGRWWYRGRRGIIGAGARAERNDSQYAEQPG
ncbi:hypothetical protein FRUB_02687 [Fimbriiglobus ruber]|uniref:Uncharacterized protein n=1 Tax=Fimbriiglobus ruber TaxID=1908690 RepID=A0A225DX70_9BACT|nr:hypothetical protein FRUB_02687 [Fimbriiglobus ruber]